MSYTSFDFPHTHFYDDDLRELIKKVFDMSVEVKNFVSVNAIKYANPIQWNITSQYEKNTIVIDPLTGTAYISVAPVPSGVALTREEFWTVVFDLGQFVVRASKNFSNRYEQETTLTATFATSEGQWLVWGDTLYVANVNITPGDSYVVGSNIRHITVEEMYNAVLSIIDNEAQARANADTALQEGIDDEAQARANADTALQVAIGTLADLTTEAKNNLVAAINEVNKTGGGAIAKIGDLEELITTDKSNLVNALNEVAKEADNLNIYNVLDYGAVGDGVTDDTAAIQACVDAAPSGAIVLAPKGKIYKLNSTGVNLYKACTYLMMGNFHLDSPTGACFYIDKNVAHHVNDSIIYINTVTPTSQYSIFGTTPSSINNNGNCGVIMRYAIGCEIHVESATGFTKAGVFAECDDTINGEAQQAGAENNQIILHNTFYFGTLMSCGAGLYTRSESSERNCFQANEVHIVWTFACYQCVRLDDNNYDYFASTSNLFIIAAIDNSYMTDGGAGVMCASYFNRFIVAYMGCNFICNTYSGFNDIEVSNSFQTDLGFVDAGCNNRFRSSMPGTVDPATHLGVTGYPRNFVVQNGTDYLNDSGSPLDLYFKCHNTDGTNDGAVDSYVGHKVSEYVHITKDYIEPAANSNTKTRTIHIHVPTNWYFRFSFSNVDVDSVYWVQN